MAKTLTYSQKVKGWPSFYSYYPERMVSMNNKFYSFYRGEIHVHNHPGSYIGTSTLTGVFNESPHDVKHFKTISTESEKAWSFIFETDLEKGEAYSFVKKEGEYFSNINTTTTSDYAETDNRGSQGIGVCAFRSRDGDTFTVTFDNDINKMISTGDLVIAYNEGTGDQNKVGTVTSVNGKSMEVYRFNASSAVEIGDFVLFSKPASIESYGLKGYYMKYTLSTTSQVPSSVFSIGTSLFKSYS
jgi:hypothetical protein